MGRYISCKIGDEYETVWKYAFGVQNSEMYRINTELGIGEYHMIRYVEGDGDEELDYEYVDDVGDETEVYDVDGDILILTRRDIEQLEQQIQSLKKSENTDEDKWFVAMLKAILDFTVEHPEQNQFIFEGEF